MKSKFGKFLLSLLCVGGIFGLTACQSAGHTATVPVDQCEVKIIRDEQTDEKTAVVTLGINNNTIYNTSEITISYQCYSGDDKYEAVQTEKLPIGIRHGAAGYLSYTVKVEKTSPVTGVKITKAEITGYQSLWDTYVVSFILMFIAVGVALVFFGVEIFAKGLTKEDVKEVFKERLGSTMFTLGLVLLICMIPLMFSSWVVTLILLGGFVGTILLSGVMTLIKMATVK